MEEGAVDPVEELLARMGAAPTLDEIEELEALVASIPDLRLTEVEELSRRASDFRSGLGEVVAACERYGRRGWALSHVPPRVLRNVPSEPDDDVGVSIAVEPWLLTTPLAARCGLLGCRDDELRELARHRAGLVARALRLHASGEYAAAILLAYSQCDGIVQDCEGREPFTTKAGRRAELGDHRTLAGAPLGLQRAITWHGRHSVPSERTRLSRHATLHGASVGFDTRENSAKVLLLLSAVLQWAQPRFAQLADSRVAERSAANTDRDGVDSNGWRLDKRGFTEARTALKFLQVDQQNFHHQHGRFGNTDELATDVACLQQSMWSRPNVDIEVVAEDDRWEGQVKSEAGWWFALRETPTGTQYYDGRAAPDASSIWRENDDGNWSGDCYQR